MAAPRQLRIGISACFFHADPKRAIFKGKTLLYLEQSMSHWVMRQGVLAYLIPQPPEGTPIKLKNFALELDGLVLQGGSDVAPQSYGEKPLKPEWGGDYIRDQYEIELMNEFMQLGKPVLGVCRGAQLINVACQGTLYQDIQTQEPSAQCHRDWEPYDQLFHNILWDQKSTLGKLYPRAKGGKVNSVHHQAVRTLGKNLTIEARSELDGIIEAIRLKGDPYVFGVQWHPEFQDVTDLSLLDGTPIIHDFLTEAKRRRGG